MPLKKSRYKSDAFEAIHSAVEGMYKAGTVDQATMKSFDERCLVTPATLTPAKVRKIRTSQKVSQPVFARYLNTSESTVEKWESGAKRPSGMAIKLLMVVEKHGLEVLA